MNSKLIVIGVSGITSLTAAGIALGMTLNKNSLIDDPLIFGETVLVSDGRKDCQILKDYSDTRKREIPNKDESCETEWSRNVEVSEKENKFWIRVREDKFKKLFGEENPESWMGNYSIAIVEWKLKNGPFKDEEISTYISKNCIITNKNEGQYKWTQMECNIRDKE